MGTVLGLAVLGGGLALTGPRRALRALVAAAAVGSLVATVLLLQGLPQPAASKAYQDSAPSQPSSVAAPAATAPGAHHRRPAQAPLSDLAATAPPLPATAPWCWAPGTRGRSSPHVTREHLR